MTGHVYWLTILCIIYVSDKQFLLVSVDWKGKTWSRWIESELLDHHLLLPSTMYFPPDSIPHQCFLFPIPIFLPYLAFCEILSEQRRELNGASGEQERK